MEGVAKFGGQASYAPCGLQCQLFLMSKIPCVQWKAERKGLALSYTDSVAERQPTPATRQRSASCWPKEKPKWLQGRNILGTSVSWIKNIHICPQKNIRVCPQLHHTAFFAHTIKLACLKESKVSKSPGKSKGWECLTALDWFESPRLNPCLHFCKNPLQLLTLVQLQCWVLWVESPPGF